MADTRVLPVSSVKYGLKAETGSAFGVGLDSDGNDGSFQQLFKVYGRINQNCKKKNCLGIIKKILSIDLL